MGRQVSAPDSSHVQVCWFPTARSPPSDANSDAIRTSKFFRKDIELACSNDATQGCMPCFPRKELELSWTAKLLENEGKVGKAAS